MRKSMWLLSAGLVALSMPAYAQETDTDAGGAQPTQGATAEAAAVDNQDVDRAGADTAKSSSRRPGVTKRCRTFRWRFRRSPPNASELAAQAIFAQLTQLSPSCWFLDLVGSRCGRARIRGIGTVGDNPGLESSVAVFIDGVYRSRTGVGLTELGAIDRIEVLRGPQGTLFGRNASAGLISIITAKPKFKTESAASSASAIMISAAPKPTPPAVSAKRSLPASTACG
jgi:hypothetical protein